MKLQIQSPAGRKFAKWVAGILTLYYLINLVVLFVQNEHWKDWDGKNWWDIILFYLLFYLVLPLLLYFVPLLFGRLVEWSMGKVPIASLRRRSRAVILCMTHIVICLVFYACAFPFDQKWGKEFFQASDNLNDALLLHFAALAGCLFPLLAMRAVEFVEQEFPLASVGKARLSFFVGYLGVLTGIIIFPEIVPEAPLVVPLGCLVFAALYFITRCAVWMIEGFQMPNQNPPPTAAPPAA